MLYRVAGGEAKHVCVGGPGMVKVSDVARNSQPYCREHLQRWGDWFRQQVGAAGGPWWLVF